MKNYKEQLKSLVQQMLDDENTIFYMDNDLYPFAKTEDGIYIHLLGDDVSLRDFVNVGKEYVKYTTKARATMGNNERERKIKMLQREIERLSKED